MRKWTVAAAAFTAAIGGTVAANAQPPAPPREAAEAVAARAGTFAVKMTLTKKTATIPSNASPTCMAQFFGWNSQSQTWNEEIAGMFADGAGATKTCNFNVPYSWPAVETGAPVNVRVWVQLGKDVYPNTTNAGEIPARKVMQEWTITLPANNATTEVKRTLVY